jgi:hypothetical protein
MPLLHLFRLPQTYLLLLGLAIGYGMLIRWQGTRPIVWLAGGVITGLTLVAWVGQTTRLSRSSRSADNLLDRTLFLTQLHALGRSLPAGSQPTWQQAQTWASQTQDCAVQIAQREPALLPDLLEALHTVLDLSAQVAEALQVRQTIQTPAYQQLAQHQLQLSCDRLQSTASQMQQLQDQLALSALEQQRLQTEPLPAQLRLLIANNKTSLHSSDASNP